MSEHKIGEPNQDVINAIVKLNTVVTGLDPLPQARHTLWMSSGMFMLIFDNEPVLNINKKEYADSNGFPEFMGIYVVLSNCHFKIIINDDLSDSIIAI
jgi:hypothetical protein